jgi:hypothetical protein
MMGVVPRSPIRSVAEIVTPSGVAKVTVAGGLEGTTTGCVGALLTVSAPVRSADDVTCSVGSPGTAVEAREARGVASPFGFLPHPPSSPTRSNITRGNLATKR